MSSTTLRVKELLRIKGWTMKVLSEKTGMSESYLTHIKNSTRRWNEDALEKIAAAFEIRPIDLISEVSKSISYPNNNAKVKVSFVPVVNSIPPDLITIFSTTITFVPLPYNPDTLLFALYIDSQQYQPTFLKGDYVIVSPEAKIKNGDIAAVEYGPQQLRVLGRVTLKDQFIVLEFLHEKQRPLALVQGLDHFKIIGKVIQRIQKF